MRSDREKVFELRKQGKSYREIQKLIGISRDTLCRWFKNEEWSTHIKKSNTKKHMIFTLERLKQMHAGRKLILDKRYKDTEEDALKEFEIYKNDPLFIAGIMLYVGEGDKLTKNIIRLANTDFFVHKIFIKFIYKFTGISISNIRFSVLLYPDLDIEKCKLKWSQELDIPLENFHKAQVIQGRSKIRRLHFGVGSTIISNSFLKRKILKWIELSNNSLSV